MEWVLCDMYMHYYIRYILIFSACIDKAVLLILRFWFLAPVRRLVFPVLLFLVAFLFGFVYGLRVVFRGRVDCVEYLKFYIPFSLSVFLPSWSKEEKWRRMNE